jgi:coenzyme F420-0:L-glutamate ligase/coenzyme F420-1:gamma-L-glutamate ligase
VNPIMAAPAISLLVPATMPRIGAGDDLAGEILAALQREGIGLVGGDILVVAQKVVSKAEGRLRRLEGIVPSGRALELAAATGKDARLVEVILQESKAVVRTGDNLLIVEHRLGHIMANAGVDRSNVDAAVDDDGVVLLLPEDPDRSARALRQNLAAATGARLGVIISDSFGRPWRMGTVGVAIGVAGPASLVDRRGDPDLFGRPLQVTEVGFADAIASAAVLAMGEGREGRPVVVVRGIEWRDSDQTARAVLRPRDRDVFR